MATYKITDGTATVSTYTKIDNSGLLYIGLNQKSGTLIVTATEDNVSDSATVTINALPLTGSPSNVLADNSNTGTRTLSVKVGDLTITGGTWELVKTHSTPIATSTKINNTGVLQWDKSQQSGQIGAKFTKEDMSITIPIVFKKNKISIAPKSVTLHNGASTKFTVS